MRSLEQLEDLQLRQAHGEEAYIPYRNKIRLIRHDGVTIGVCNYECTNISCRNAHPNYRGSMPRNARYCGMGSVNTCHKDDCVFNHIRNELEFIAFRSKGFDRHWLYNNIPIIIEYLDKVSPFSPAPWSNHEYIYEPRPPRFENDIFNQSESDDEFDDNSYDNSDDKSDDESDDDVEKESKNPPLGTTPNQSSTLNGPPTNDD